jgi:S1-C subfamily serine protease
MRRCELFTICVLKHLNSYLIIYFFLVSFCLVGTAQAQQNGSRITQKADWATFVSKNPEECWSVSLPKKSINRKNGKNVSVKRSDILLFTFFRPVSGVKGQITFTPGYPPKKVSLRVGSQTFDMSLIQGEWAWARSASEDKKILAAFQRGRTATITATSQRGIITQDTFSLIGYSSTTNEAATRCGMAIPKPKLAATKRTVGDANTSNCLEDASKCSVAELCAKSTIESASGKKVWNTEKSAKKFVTAAQDTGLSCGVEKNIAESSPAPSNEKYKVASGTGFFVTREGHLITNHHVVEGCEDVKLHSKGNIHLTTKIANDVKNDLAILKVDQVPSHIFPLADKSPFPLQDIIVAGFPFGDRVSSSLKFTQGIVSSVSGIANDYSQIQIDAALQPGNSGGPILDKFGNVVAVAVAKLSLEKILEDFGVVPENTNFGVKASAVKNLMEGNRLQYKSSNTEILSKQELSQATTDGTVFLSCWMTAAQIEEMRTTKVLFSELN